VLFLFPAERIHYLSMDMLRLICRVPIIKNMLTSLFNRSDAGHRKHIFGLQFRNGVGLAAGFDKNAKYLSELEVLGFGFIEIGTVTPLPQPGNEKPRLFRLPADRALINRMGFNNEGVKAAARRLNVWREKQKQQDSKAKAGATAGATQTPLIIGGNIGKNKLTPNEDAWKDYETCFRELYEYVDYFVVNVSSPNTPGLRELQEKESLKKILSHLQTVSLSQYKQKPILLKIAPDLTLEQLDDVIDLAAEIKLDGLVATNTTISRTDLLTPSSSLQSIGNGGLSGKPLTQKATSIIEYIHHQSNGTIPIVASGGIFTAKDAREKINAGASLIQVWTGFVYEGPSIVKNILRG
jgi:dihydroorotate dehydrogenase